MRAPPFALPIVLALASSAAVACQKRDPEGSPAAVGSAMAGLACAATQRVPGAAVGSRLVATLPFEIDVSARFARDGSRVLYEHNSQGRREVRALGVGEWSYTRVSEVRVSDVGGAFAILAVAPDQTEMLLRRESGERSLGRWPVTIHFLPGTSRLFVADRERACVDDHCESLRCDGVIPDIRDVIRSPDGRFLVLTSGIPLQSTCMFVVTFAGASFSMRRIEGAYGAKLVTGAADLTYIQRATQGAFVVHGDTRWGPYAEPPAILDLSPSGAHVGYAVRESPNWVVRADGETVYKEPIGPSHEVCTPSVPPHCSPQAASLSVSFAFVGEAYTKGAIPSFAPKPQAIHGTRAAAVFRDRTLGVRAGKTEWTGFEMVDERSLSFSEDGRRLRFGAITRPSNDKLEVRWYDVEVP